LNKYVLEFEINDLPKTYNSLGRAHWTVKAKEARKWISLVGFVSSSKRPKECLRKCSLELVRFSTRSPDFDGLVSSFKHVLDGLTKAQIICGDKIENTGVPNYRWEKAKKGEGKIKVRVESVE
jgi:Holliday junction resolvase RusA-like endonuclease